MGWVYASEISKAGRYLLVTLKEEGQVPYSRFYDGTDETHAELVKAIGYPEEGDDYEPDSPELLMDLAAGELEDQGFVKLTTLNTRLADEEPDYLIELTAQGREMIANGKEPRFRDLEL